MCLKKGKKRIHFATRAEYNKQKKKYKGWEVKYYKGLGSMQRQDWDIILNGKADTFIPIVDDGKIADTLRLLFSNDTDARKEWLQ